MVNPKSKTLLHAAYILLNPGRSASGHEIGLHANNIIGRLPLDDRLSGRSEQPSVFMDSGVQRILFDVAILSKDHARIFFAKKAWFIRNLSTYPGTCINGKRLSLRDVQLDDGDSIFVGPVQVGFYLREAERETHNGALLIGHPGTPHLGGVENDLHAFEAALMARKNFSGNIVTLFKENARKAAVFAAFDRLSGVLSRNSAFLFYFSGHGRIGGLQLYDGLLNPQELYSHINAIRGQKVVLLDCCHSTSFVHDAASDMLLITGDSPSHEMFEGKATVLGSIGPFGKKVHGYLTRAFVNVLEQEGGKIGLKEAAEKVGEYHRLKRKKVEVIAHGGEVVVRSVLGMPPPKPPVL